MPKSKVPPLPKDVAATLELAEAFAADERVIAAFHAAADNDRLRKAALTDAAGYLGKRGIEIPPRIGVQFLELDLPGRPYPLEPSFTIRLTKCRTYWVLEKLGSGAPTWRQVTACFGFEIIPQRFSPIG